MNPAYCSLLCVLAVSVIGTVSAEKGAYLDEIDFVQYLDENTALEEVRAGNLDVYYYRIPAERLEDPSSRQGIRVFESQGGSYSILVNPADSGDFNPFSIREVRFALNHVIDRKLVINELMGGYGTNLVSNYGPNSAEYLHILDAVQPINSRYDPQLARGIIDSAMTDAGAAKRDGVWHFDGTPVQIRMFIRSDDPVRKSMGEILSSEIEKLGFTVHRNYGDLNKAFVTVYGSDPANLEWSIYTEGWGAPSALVKYDQVGLAQMYSPWFSSMPGFNSPGYWNYKSEKLDSITQAIYASNFTSESERASLMRQATVEGVNEAVRIFIATKKDLYVASGQVDGLVNDFGAGIPNRLSLINAKTDSGYLRVGVKQIYQGSWNPVMGFTDYYSSYIWGVLSDPASFRHPYTGQILPLRTSWSVQSAGQDSALHVPPDAVRWDDELGEWIKVGDGVNATSSVTLDYVFGDWHHGESIDMSDVMYSAYFMYAWGTDSGPSDLSKDSEFTARAAPYVQTIKGLRQIDDDTLQIYVDYWHFDEAEIAAWAAIWPSVPWEINAAMERIVTDGKASFSKSGATAKGTKWISLIVPNDALLVKEQLDDFIKSDFVHPALAQYAASHDDRFRSASEWIDKNDHALIGNGPFEMGKYSPESRTIKISLHESGYPIGTGYAKYDAGAVPQITETVFPKTVIPGQDAYATVHTENAQAVRYYVTDSKNSLLKTGSVSAISGTSEIVLSGDETAGMAGGAGHAAFFAVSDSILRTDSHTVHFLVAGSDVPPPEYGGNFVRKSDAIDAIWAYAAAAAAAAALSVYAVLKRRRN